jgi:iron complex transport system substrate-binding protein
MSEMLLFSFSNVVVALYLIACTAIKKIANWRRAAVRIAAGFFALMCLHAGVHAAAMQVIDDRGMAKAFAQPPTRIVSMLPSLTESVCALDQCQRLVGVDRYSDYPASVKALPSLGGGLDPNIEAIVALKPDLVLVAVSSRASSRLEALGLKVIALEATSHGDVRRALQILGAVLGIPDENGARRLWSGIEQSLAVTAQSLTPAARKATVYFDVGRGPYAASESSFMGETLARLGVRNVVPASLGAFPKLSPEFVVRANPDVIITSSAGRSELVSYPGWAGIRAVKEGRICALQPDESGVIVRPGPRLAEAARIMARCLEQYAARDPR